MRKILFLSLLLCAGGIYAQEWAYTTAGIAEKNFTQSRNAKGEAFLNQLPFLAMVSLSKNSTQSFGGFVIGNTTSSATMLGLGGCFNKTFGNTFFEMGLGPALEDKKMGALTYTFLTTKEVGTKGCVSWYGQVSITGKYLYWATYTVLPRINLGMESFNSNGFTYIGAKVELSICRGFNINATSNGSIHGLGLSWQNHKIIGASTKYFSKKSSYQCPKW